MNILDKIIERKKEELIQRKKGKSISDLRLSELYSRKRLSLRNSLLDTEKSGIIAEFKRKSPSKGTINNISSVEEVTGAYAKNGASGLSVLTDQEFFGGSTEDLMRARVNQIPILRKDFMIDEYQVIEARSMGADIILLIAACLTPKRVEELAAAAKGEGLEVLLEIHNEDELKHICDDVDLVGVNNRNLKDFQVDVETSVRLSGLIPGDKIKISESGIDNISAIQRLKVFGYKGFLMGEYFMKQPDPSIAFARFVQQLKTSTNAT
ncbi:MAG: indole-3-glycerol phosphate synthase TrpC [Bacteroidetes bacterium]|nr:MAG: indole-3-glycerol phosphate synthase TrpC [Bacteroidota bacterium]